MADNESNSYLQKLVKTDLRSAHEMVELVEIYLKDKV